MEILYDEMSGQPAKWDVDCECITEYDRDASCILNLADSRRKI